jgi:IS4 transposase
MHPLTLSSSGHLMLLTSLPAPAPAEEVLAAYRLRWQVELAFKRLKSLLGIDRLPAKSDTLARSWLFAHLILALLIDAAARDLLPDSPPCADQPSVSPDIALAPGCHPA